jgi:hypothetical protein
MTAFMIASKEPKGRRIPDFKGPKIKNTLQKGRLEKVRKTREGRYLYGEITTVNIIAKKKIHGVRRITANLKQFHQVVILAMDIATHYGSVNVLL